MTHRFRLSALQWVSSMVLLASSATAMAKGVERPESVELRWKVARAPQRYVLNVRRLPESTGLIRHEPSAVNLWGLPEEERVKGGELLMPSELEMAAELTRLPSGDVSAQVKMTRVVDASPEKDAPADVRRRRMFKDLEGQVLATSSLMDIGVITAQLTPVQHNLVALLFELPGRPVAVGDTWTHSADLVGARSLAELFWEEERSVRVNRVRLSSLVREAKGRTVAVIDFTLMAEDKGEYVSWGPGRKRVPASDAAYYVGRGEFLVEEGRWRTLSGELSLRASGGVLAMDSAHRFTMTPVDSTPAGRLKAR
ncbi:lipoprotein [Myxococcus stipitatus DSM 14675]|uniref:Lipoprotein n=1 Tax=Myxococcus stipitatus (strain DSM 14675 / JCM 12634 / Mx s8) TaxID=1278073 RepID=L7U5A8_MYXSD|nr:hypothetical protein [Myxococcus stipitatus]AGC43308.1 lipoprotein [Myxococcus stipitatus DSM 14675]